MSGISGPVQVQGFRDGGFRINGQYWRSLLLRGDALHVLEVETLEALGFDHLAPLLDSAPPLEVLLIGTGATMKPLPHALRLPLAQRQIAADAMDSRAAARTFSILQGEARRVGAVLLPCG